jgi:hypothetical protein
LLLVVASLSAQLETVSLVSGPPPTPLPRPDLYEAISRFALENAVVLLAKWRIIKIVRVEGAQNSKRAVQLSPEYQDHAKIEELVREISMYRKRSRVWKEECGKEER